MPESARDPQFLANFDAAMAKRRSLVPSQEWEELRGGGLSKLLEKIGPNLANPPQLAHLPNDAPPQLVVAYLHRDGGVIIDQAVSEEVCDATVAQMEPYIEQTGTGDAFTGKHTKRTGCVLLLAALQQTSK